MIRGVVSMSIGEGCAAALAELALVANNGAGIAEGDEKGTFRVSFCFSEGVIAGTSLESWSSLDGSSGEAGAGTRIDDELDPCFGCLGAGEFAGLCPGLGLIGKPGLNRGDTKLLR